MLWTVKDKLPVIGLNTHSRILASRKIANTDFWFLCAKYSLAFTGFTKAILIHAREEVESLAQRLIAKYPDDYLSEPELIMWEGWAVAIRGPDIDGLDTPKAIIRGTYMEIRAFELVYQRIKAKRSPLMADDRIAIDA